MEYQERLARTVSKQRTGNEEGWERFLAEVKAAIAKSQNGSGLPRDYLDYGYELDLEKPV